MEVETIFTVVDKPARYMDSDRQPRTALLRITDDHAAAHSADIDSSKDAHIDGDGIDASPLMLILIDSLPGSPAINRLINAADIVDLGGDINGRIREGQSDAIATDEVKLRKAVQIAG